MDRSRLQAERQADHPTRESSDHANLDPRKHPKHPKARDARGARAERRSQRAA